MTVSRMVNARETEGSERDGSLKPVGKSRAATRAGEVANPPGPEHNKRCDVSYET